MPISTLRLHDVENDTALEIKNDQLLYNLAMACYQTAKNQWTGDEFGLYDLFGKYFRSTFLTHSRITPKNRQAGVCTAQDHLYLYCRNLLG